MTPRRFLVLSAVILVHCATSPQKAAPPPQAPERAKTPPPAARALRAGAQTAAMQGKYARCAELLARAAEIDPEESPKNAYDAACCLAKSGNSTRAFQKLQESLDRGFRDLEWLKRDPDLQTLHPDGRWNPLLERAQVKFDVYLKTINAELYQIFQDDQADRRPGPQGINWAEVTPRDEKRRLRVEKILDSGGAKASDDYFYAAMVFQHGHEIQDFQLSHQLALKAVELDPNNRAARWLAAAAKDRELMNLGKPQLYGTQYRMKDGRMELYQVDPTITDEERAKWNVPPLEEAKRRAEALSGRK
jgi:tetratricopeptide (TPR) repeat protein